MRKMILVFVLLLPVFLFSTVIPGGDVSGLWDVAGSPYYIDGEITIQSETELEIEAGVDVVFNDHYKLIIYGRIVANGTAADSISFTPLNSTSGWHGLRFFDGNLSSLPASEISYCQFKRGYALGSGNDPNGGAIFCSNTSNLTIDNSYFYLNYSQWDGGAVYVGTGSDIQINNCLFLENDSSFYGGAMISYASAPVLNNCTFKLNTSAIFAAGFSFWNASSPELYNCSFLDNSAGACAGVYGVGSNLIMANILFSNNSTATGSGAAAGLTSCNTEASNITAVDNISPLSGGAFWVNGGNLDLYNSILWNNLPEDIFAISGGTYNAYNSCISDGTAGTAVISDDPHFADYVDGDFHLLETSPCIDTGDESLPAFTLPIYDLDGNDRVVDGDLNGTATIDMGVYEFAPVIQTTGFIAGNVTDIYGNPLDNAEINAGIYATNTNSSGEYSMEVEADDYTVSCYLDGYEIPDDVQVTVIATETVTVDFVLELTPTSGFIAGTVTDDAGNLLENAEITAGIYTVLTDANGEFEVEVEEGDYTVSCYLEGYEIPDDMQVTVVATETVIADFVLIPEVNAQDQLVAENLALLGNYPNPFNPNTTISFSLPKNSRTVISIFNSNGQIVNHLCSEILQSGIHQIAWNGIDDNGRNAASGIYFYKITTETATLTGRMLMLK